MSDPGPLLRVRLRPSWTLAALILAAHGLAGACILAVSMGPAALALALLMLALGAASARDRALLRARQSPRVLELRADGRLEVRCADGSTLAADDAARVVNRWLVILGLRNRKRSSVLIVAGMLECEEFRRLRMWALWGRLPGVAPAQLPG